jgi:hypothetical protein
MVFDTGEARDETLDYILGQLAKHDDRLKEAELDITGLRIELSQHDEEIDSNQETLISHESRISSNENKLSALDGIMEVVNDHQLKIDALLQTSASHQNSIEELTSTTRNLDPLPLGTIMSYHPKNAETFPFGWLPCDGSNIDKGPLMGQRTPGNLTLSNLT